MSFSTRVALRYFRSRKGFVSVVSGFSLTGIIIGVAALIVVMAVMTGFRDELFSRILGIGGHATVTFAGTSTSNMDEIKQKIESIKGVHHAQPFVHGQAMALAGNKASGVLIRGVDVENSDNLIFNKIIAGNQESLKKPGRVAIGSALARELQVGVGSVVSLLSPDGSQTAFGFIPRIKKYKVAAVFDVGMELYDGVWMYMDIPTAQIFYKLDNRITGFDVRMNKPDDVDVLYPKIPEVLGENGRVITWKTSNKQFFDALQVERVAMFVILSLIVVVAAFNIITGQMMTVNDKHSDIAILRTMGASKWQILKVFFGGGLLVGVIGTGAGLSAGLLIVSFLQEIVSFLEFVFSVNIFSGEAYFLDELPAIIVWSDVVKVGALSLGLSALASLFPAYKAASTDPVEVLRHE